MRALIFLVALGAACEKKDELFPVLITVQTDDGEPLPSLPVTVKGVKAGVTDASGRVRMRLVGREGMRLPIGVTVPQGFRPLPESTSVVLRHLEREEKGAHKVLPVEQVIALQPLVRKYAIMVRTGVPNLPVEVFGVTRATTNSEGAAIFLYEGAPGDEVKVRLVTERMPQLAPQNPQSSLVLGATTSAYVIKERFTVPAPTPIRRIRTVIPRKL